MSANDTPGMLTRIDRWLGQQLDGVFRLKQQLEASYYERKAESAEDAGNLDKAEKYYDEARTLRGRLGDREATVDLAMRHASVAHENGNLGPAREEYERVVELYARREDARGALDALEPLLEILDSEGDDDALSEWWGHAMMIVGKAEPGEIADDRRDRIIENYADQIHTEGSVGRLYGFAAQRFLEGEDEAGADLLDATWDRKDVVREQIAQFRVLLAAGVGLVAYSELNDREIDSEEILSFVDDHRDKLSDAATALFEQLYEGETDTAAEELRMDLDPQDENELRDVESEVFGRFLEELA